MSSDILTPPMFPVSPPFPSSPHTTRSNQYASRTRSPLSAPTSPEFALPPPLSLSAQSEHLPVLSLPGPSVPFRTRTSRPLDAIAENDSPSVPPSWRPDLSPVERDAREAYLAGGRGRAGLRIVIVTENFLPKVDGVTRTLARLLEHLEREGHQCMLLGPETGMGHYASHPLVGTAGVPLVVYPGLKLNFLRPKFLRAIKDFQPDVVHFVDPIWLGAQTLIAMELGWAGEEWVSEEGPAMGAGIRGAVVASYHTNLATYASLFGMAWLEPIMWKLQQWLYSKTLMTLCPSPSTARMLQDQQFSGVRLWPRGVDLSQFGPSKRCVRMRASWGVGDVPNTEEVKVKGDSVQAGTDWAGRQVSLPMTPPLTPWAGPVDDGAEQAGRSSIDSIPALSPASTSPTRASFASLGATFAAEPAVMPNHTPGPGMMPRRAVLLYVGRVSWEKNLHLLLAAYARLKSYLSAGTPLPKLVFVGDGPARVELEAICGKKGYDATFMGHRSGEELARCYASADVFAFPSFTETFGQVVLEALASGLPVIGLDAEGTRDLVTHEQTGLLLPLPAESSVAVTGAKNKNKNAWPAVCRDHSNPLFISCAERYAALLARATCNHAERESMGARASTEGIAGYTWWDAMEKCVDGYRESLRMAREKRKVSVVTHTPSSLFEEEDHGYTPASSPVRHTIPLPSSPPSRISRVNRVVSRRLAHKGAWAPNAIADLRPPLPAEERAERRFTVRRAKVDTSETIWHLKTLLKLVLAIALFYGVYSHHLASKGAVTAIGKLAV